jgi:CDGSH-type Zn-finger protein
MAAKVTVRNNGPLVLSGEFELLDTGGRSYGLGGRTSISLCRCGHSENKPFCDGSHNSCNFQSTVEAFELALPKPKL